MKRVTKKAMNEFLRHKILTDESYALKALVEIFKRQTDTEKVSHKTLAHNGIGFTAFDAEILSSIAEVYLKYGSLTFAQLQLVQKRIVKYSRQLMELSEKKGKIQQLKTLTREWIGEI